MRRMIVALCSMTLLLLNAASVCSQNKKEPPPRQAAMPVDSASEKNEATLPKIDLPEFVITGNQSVDLPEAAKASSEEKWLNYSSQKVEAGVREMSSAPLGGAGRESPGFIPSHKGYSGKAQVGFGSYSSPSLDAWFGNSSAGVNVLLKAGYRSSGGHIANASFRSGDAALSTDGSLGDEFGIFSGNSVQAQIGMRGKGYRLYGSTNPVVQRTATIFDGSVVMNSATSGMIPYTSRFVLQSNTLKDSSRATETSVGFEFNGSKNVGSAALQGDVALWKSFFLTPSPNNDPYFTRVGGSIGYRLAQSLDIRAGLDFYLFRGSDMKSLGRFYPQLGVSWFANEKLTVYAKFEPAVLRNSLALIQEANPYAITNVSLRHTEQFTDFSLGAEAAVVPTVHSRVSLNYTQADNAAAFVDPQSVRMWNIEYSGTSRTVSFNGEIYADITESDNVGASISIRSNRNSLTGKPNPYFPLFMSSIAFSHRFDFGLTVNNTLQIIGRQSIDPAHSRRLPAFALLNMKAEYIVLSRWSILCMLDNLFDQHQTWWEGYAGVGRTVSFGTSFSW